MIHSAFIIPLLACSALAQSWTDLSPVPLSALQEHITLSPNPNQIITLGGMVGSNTTDTVFLYSIPNNTWTTLSPLPIPLNHPNAIVSPSSPDKIYLLGGLTEAPNWPATPNSYIYDVPSNTWRLLKPMPSALARGSAASAIYNTTIFLAGGIPRSSGRTLDTVSAYHIPSDSWVTLPDAASRLPAARDHAGYAQIGSKFFVIGGRENGVRAVKDTVFILDMTDLGAGWKTSSARMPTARGGLVAAAVGSRIYTFGGEGNVKEGSRGVFDQVEVYDSEGDRWLTELEGVMRVPRHGTSAVSVDGRVYIPGGGVVEGVGATSGFDVFVP